MQNTFFSQGVMVEVKKCIVLRISISKSDNFRQEKLFQCCKKSKNPNEYSFITFSLFINHFN